MFRTGRCTPSPMKVTYYGHSCFLVEVADAKLLFDPFIRPNPLAAAVNVEAIPADYILLSHGHFDHVADAGEIARRTGATLIANFEIIQWFAAQGLEKGHPMNLGGGYKFPFGRVKLVPAIHSSQMPDGSYGGNPGGFLVETGEGNFFYSGDTALTSDFKLIGGTTSLKFAALCLGDNFTMGPEDAARAATMLECAEILGVHYDTFPPIVIDRDRAARHFHAAQCQLHLPAIGASLEF